MYSLAPTKWLLDSVIQASIKSILTLHPLEPLVGYLPHSFIDKLLNANHSNREMEGKHDYSGIQTWFKKKFGKDKQLSDMSTLVMLQNEGRYHWNCYGIFVKRNFI